MIPLSDADPRPVNFPVMTMLIIVVSFIVFFLVGQAAVVGGADGPIFGLLQRRLQGFNLHREAQAGQEAQPVLLEKLGLVFVDRKVYFGMEMNRYAAQRLFWPSDTQTYRQLEAPAKTEPPPHT